MKDLMKELENGIETLFESNQYQEYLTMMAKFHRYSFNNSMLIFTQCPNATYVAGYKTWKKEFNRYVRKGEKAIRIMAPMKIKDKQQDEERLLFKTVYVFDISQTEGDPLPSIVQEELDGKCCHYDLFVQTLIDIARIDVRFEPLSDGIHGYYDRKNDRIVIDDCMQEVQTIKTLLHEIAHSRLHQTKDVDKRTREVEAESIAYVVSKYYGIDTSKYSFGYIVSWAEDQTLELLKKSMNRIQKTAKRLIFEIDRSIEQESKQDIIKHALDQSVFVC